MTLQSSGIIKMSEIRSELSETGAVNLGKASWRGLAGKASGTIKMSDFYGKTSRHPFNITVSTSGISNWTFSPSTITTTVGVYLTYSGTYDLYPSKFCPRPAGPDNR